jgi:diguanylate cyclase (GGDEF)-like protein
VARALQLAAPPGSIVARWGGEEFAIAVRGELSETPEALGERLRCAVKAIVLHEAGATQRVTASVGLAHDGVARRCWSSADLIHAADKALYESKRTGRDRVTVATTAA